MGDLGAVEGVPALAVEADARRVEFVDADDVVESSGNSTTFHVCKVASGANDTLRFAGSHVSSAFYRIKVHLPSDFLLASLLASISCRSRSFAAACCSSSLRTAIRVGDRAGERGLEAPGVGEVSNGFGRP